MKATDTVNRHCPKCNTATTHGLRKSGPNVGWRCLACDSWVPRRDGKGLWIPTRALQEGGVNYNEVIDITPDRTACERCHDTKTLEVHHWAPAALFSDSKEWPTSNLCRACHRQWHETVTPQLVMW